VDFLIYVLEDTQETSHFDVTRTRQFYNGILEFLIFSQPAVRAAVLDQVTPDICLVSSKADDRFIDLCSDSSTNLLFGA
jgi:hypothetical protein